MNSIKQKCQSLLLSNSVSIRELSSIVGKLMAIAPAFSPAPLQVRYLQKKHEPRSKMKQSKLQGDNIPEYISNSGSTMVDKELRNIQWETNQNNTPRPNNKFRCSRRTDLTWGAHCQGVSTGGLWTSLERTHHINILELKAAFLAIKTFTKDTTVDSPTHRQHCSTSSPSENGKTNKSNTDKSDKANLVISTVKKDNSDSRIHTLGTECRGRFRVTKLDGSQRMDAKQTCVPNDHKDMGYTLNRPVCVTNITPSRKLLQLEN